MRRVTLFAKRVQSSHGSAAAQQQLQDAQTQLNRLNNEKKKLLVRFIKDEFSEEQIQEAARHINSEIAGWTTTIRRLEQEMRTAWATDDKVLATNIASLFGTFSFLNAEERKTLLRKVVVAIHTTSGAISKVILRLPTDVAKLCIHTNVNAQFHNSIEVPIEPAVPFKMLPPSKLNKLRIPDRQQYFTAHAAEALGVTKDERSARLATEIYPPVRKDSRGRGVFTLKDVECLAKILNGQVEPKIKTSGERPEQEEIKEESCDTAIFQLLSPPGGSKKRENALAHRMRYS